MKKLLLVILALAALITFAACSTTEPSTETTINDEDAVTATQQNSTDTLATERLSEPYAELMMSGHYYIESKLYVAGMEVPTTIAVDGNNSDTIGNAFGYQSRTLILDGIMYSFDEANMTYTATPAAENADPSTTYNYTNMQYRSSGSSTIAGLENIDTNTYKYEEYVCTIDTNDTQITVPIRFYMNDEDLYAIAINTLGIETVLLITTMSEDIPEGMLQMPEGYTEVADTSQQSAN